MSIIDVEDEECLDSYTMPIRKGNYTSIREASKSNGIYRKTKKNRQKFSSLFEDTDDSEEELAQELGESFFKDEKVEVNNNLLCKNRRYLQHGEKEKSQDDETWILGLT